MIRIRDWAKHYENNRTREMKTLSWVPVKIKLSGFGYSLLAETPSGFEYFGIFVACVQAAANTPIRGSFVRGDGSAMTIGDIARIIRCKEDRTKTAISFLSHELDWIENTEDTSPAAKLRDACGEAAGCLRDACGKVCSTEQNRTEQNPKRMSRITWPDSSPEFLLAKTLWQSIEASKTNQKKPNLQRWASEFDLMHRIEKRDYDWMRETMLAARRDPFWQDNIRSPDKLRKQINIGKMDRFAPKTWKTDAEIIAEIGAQDGNNTTQ